ncbi:unnamed protein product [Trichobilharzia szidati]|nr:unnamed protein product [Trichobilharzia szidati]
MRLIEPTNINFYNATKHHPLLQKLGLSASKCPIETVFLLLFTWNQCYQHFEKSKLFELFNDGPSETSNPPKAPGVVYWLLSYDPDIFD